MEVVIQEAVTAVYGSGEIKEVQMREQSPAPEGEEPKKRNSDAVSMISQVERDEPTKFSMLPKDDPVDIQFENVRFTATKGIFKKGIN